MSAKTRIWVFHMRELIYTAVFVGLGIIFLILMIFMFASDQKQETAAELPSKYTAGIYTASMTLGGNPVEIAVTVDEDYISSIRFRQLAGVNSLKTSVDVGNNVLGGAVRGAQPGALHGNMTGLNAQIDLFHQGLAFAQICLHHTAEV